MAGEDAQRALLAGAQEAGAAQQAVQRTSGDCPAGKKRRCDPRWSKQAIALHFCRLLLTYILRRKATHGLQHQGNQALLGMPYTVSLAVPGSVIENTQTMELATAVAGLLARTAAVFCIDEVVVVDDAPGVRRATTAPSAWQSLFVGAAWQRAQERAQWSSDAARY